MQKKRLVVCFDGTWNSADSAGGAETNVARIARAVRANSGEDKVPQLCLYLRGIGTSGSDAARLFAGATGDGIADTIRSAYRFIAQNYESADPKTDRPADDIFLFGFSRGAFAARSLAGWLGATGLLKRQSMGELGRAWDFYRRKGVRNPDAFLAEPGNEATRLHRDLQVTFLGVWDTVGSLGVPAAGMLTELTAGLFEFHDTEPSRIIRHGAHALAIDEHRDAFVPTLWTGKAPEGCVIEQVWFAGAHADVGGGYGLRTLADIPLRWMARRAEACGLQLDWDMLPSDTYPLAPMHNSRWLLELDPRETVRRVCGRNVRVRPYERLAAPFDRLGNPLEPIGEYLHESVVARWGRMGLLAGRDEEKDAAVPKLYRPRSLAGSFVARDQVAEGIRVWRD